MLEKPVTASLSPVLALLHRANVTIRDHGLCPLFDPPSPAAHGAQCLEAPRLTTPQAPPGKPTPV